MTLLLAEKSARNSPIIEFFGLAIGSMLTRYWSNSILINKSHEFKFEVKRDLLISISRLELPVYEQTNPEDLNLILVSDTDKAINTMPSLFIMFSANERWQGFYL